MTNTVRMLLKAVAALAITATFGSASFAGEFTVHQGKRYRATLALNSVERLADNALIARKFRALGFSKVRVSGAGAVRRVEGVWPRKDASATLPRQIVAVARSPAFPCWPGGQVGGQISISPARPYGTSGTNGEGGIRTHSTVTHTTVYRVRSTASWAPHTSESRFLRRDIPRWMRIGSLPDPQ